MFIFAEVRINFGLELYTRSRCTELCPDRVLTLPLMAAKKRKPKRSYERMHEVEVRLARKWKAEGKGFTEIAELLGRGRNTVRLHLAKRANAKPSPKGRPPAISQ